MAIRVAAVTIFALTLAVPFLGQTSQSDSQTLQAILAEIRAIHNELKVTQTTQILLTELEIQQSVVNRATQRVDEAQSRLSEIKTAEKDNAGEQARLKDALDRRTDPQEAEAIADKVEELKRQAATMATAEQERTSTLQTAQQQLKDAQDSLDDIQNQLNAIVKQLTPARN
jgi:chromosome segregation ATPase